MCDRVSYSQFMYFSFFFLSSFDQRQAILKSNGEFHLHHHTFDSSCSFAHIQFHLNFMRLQIYIHWFLCVCVSPIKFRMKWREKLFIANSIFARLITAPRANIYLLVLHYNILCTTKRPNYKVTTAPNATAVATKFIDWFQYLRQCARAYARLAHSQRTICIIARTTKIHLPRSSVGQNEWRKIKQHTIVLQFSHINILFGIRYVWIH